MVRALLPILALLSWAGLQNAAAAVEGAVVRIKAAAGSRSEDSAAAFLDDGRNAGLAPSDVSILTQALSTALDGRRRAVVACRERWLSLEPSLGTACDPLGVVWAIANTETLCGAGAPGKRFTFISVGARRFCAPPAEGGGGGGGSCAAALARAGWTGLAVEAAPEHVDRCRSALSGTGATVVQAAVTEAQASTVRLFRAAPQPESAVAGGLDLSDDDIGDDGAGEWSFSRRHAFVTSSREVVAVGQQSLLPLAWEALPTAPALSPAGVMNEFVHHAQAAAPTLLLVSVNGDEAALLGPLLQREARPLLVRAAAGKRTLSVADTPQSRRRWRSRSDRRTPPWPLRGKGCSRPTRSTTSWGRGGGSGAL